MKQGRISLALAGAALSAALLAAVWPHAHEAGAILAAQDDPAALADLNVGTALRNNESIVAQNIDAALAGGDADLANSFVELARDNNVALTEEASQRVADAVKEETSS